MNSINLGNVNTVIELLDLTKIKSNLNGGILPSFMIRDIIQSAYKIVICARTIVVSMPKSNLRCCC